MVVRAHWAALLGLSLFCQTVSAQDRFLVADHRENPGRVILAETGSVVPWLERHLAGSSDVFVSKVRSLSLLRDGRLVYVSGVDRSIMVYDRVAERQLRYGGGQVRQVRVADDGHLYMSTLETPIDGNPLPDGLISRVDSNTGESTPLLTFSQEVVGREFWGAFDVHRDKIYAGTLSDRTRIYDVTRAAPVELIAELPFNAPSFRFSRDGVLYACDGRGKVYRFPDLRDTNRSEVVLDIAEPFTDFIWAP
jgi:hypothetical protein